MKKSTWYKLEETAIDAEGDVKVGKEVLHKHGRCPEVSEQQ